MRAIAAILYLCCSHAAPSARAIAARRRADAAPDRNDRDSPFRGTILPPPLSRDTKEKRRTLQGAGVGATGPYTGVTIAGPSGNLEAGDTGGSGGGYGSNVWVNQGSSGTIVVETQMTDMVLPVTLVFANVPFGYRLFDSDRDYMVDMAMRMITAGLDPAFELLEVTYPGILPMNNGYGWSGGWQGGSSNNYGGSFNLPLRVVLRGPEHISASAQSYVIQAIMNNIQLIMNEIRIMDADAFPQLTLSVDAYDFADIVDYTNDPTQRPTREPTREPTRRPTREPTPRPTPGPSREPTRRPTREPTAEPTKRPTVEPSQGDTPEPTSPAPTSAEPTTYEPTSAEPTTYDPTEVPLIEHTVPLQFNLDDIAPGYTPSAEDQEAILAMLDDLMKTHLSPPNEISDTSYSNCRRRTLTEELESSLYLPVDITVKGPPGSMDGIYEELLEIAKTKAKELMENLKDYDYESFKDVEVSTEPVDVEEPESDTAYLTHPAQIVFNGVEEGYELSETDQSSFIDEVAQSLESEFDEEWELIQVTHARRFKLDDPTPHLPVQVTVSCPIKASGRTQPVIVDILEDKAGDYEKVLESLDPRAFEDVLVTIGEADQPPIDVPTFVTEHPVKVTIHNVQPDFTLTTELQTNIITYVKDIVREDLDVSLELIEVEYAGKMASAPGDNVVSLPLRVTVKGDQESSEKTGVYVIDIIDKYDLNMKDFLTELDPYVFAEASISAETFDFGAIIDVSAAPETQVTTGVEVAPGSGATFGLQLGLGSSDTESGDTAGETIHHVQLTFQNAADEHLLSDADRASVVGFVENLMDANLEPPLQLVQVEYAGTVCDLSRLTLRVTVLGPPDEIEFRLAYVMQIVEDHRPDLEMLIKSMGYDGFKNLGISVDTYDPLMVAAAMVRTVHPVQLIFDNVSAGYRLPPKDAAAVLRVAEELMENNLLNSFQVEVTDKSRSCNTTSLPLHVAVEGPAEESCLVSARVMGIFQDNMQVFLRKLQDLDWDAFWDVDMRVEEYDESDMCELVGMQRTVHEVQLNVEDLPAGYSLSRKDRESIVGFLGDLLDDDLVDLFDIVEVEDLSDDRNRSLLSGLTKKTRRLNTVSMPLSIAVTGPAEDSDLAYARVMMALEETKMDLKEKLEIYDRSTFEDGHVYYGPVKPKKETVHEVQLNVENLPAGYSLSRKDRESIVDFLGDLLDDDLLEFFDMIEVEDLSDDRNRGLLLGSTQKTRRLNTVSMPLGIVVTGPAEDSDLAHARVMVALEETKMDLKEKLEIYDRSTFEDGHVYYGPVKPSEETVHAIQLNLENVPDSYDLSPKDRDSIVEFVKEVLDDDLVNSLQLIDVNDAFLDRKCDFASPAIQKTRRLKTLTLPLHVVVKGPAKDSDSALSHVMMALEDADRDLEEKLKDYDWGAFRDANVYYGNFVEETVHEVQLNLENVRVGYSLSRNDRESIVGLVNEALDDHLVDPFQLIEIADMFDNLSQDLFLSTPKQELMRFNTVSLPLRVAVNGPTMDSDSAFCYVMMALEDAREDLEGKLRAYDRSTFRNVNMYYGSAREESVHVVNLSLEDVPGGYDLSRKDRGTIIDFVTDLLDGNLVNSFQVIGVEDVFNDEKCDLLSTSIQKTRRLDAVSMPLRVAVFGPADESDMVLYYVRMALEDTKQDLKRKLQTYDWNTFKNANAFFSNAMGETIHEVQLNLENVPVEYSLINDRESIMGFVEEVLDDHLVDSLQLIEIADMFDVRNQDLLSLSTQEPMRFNIVSLPLRLTVSGPGTDSDSAFCYVMMALEDNKQDLEEKLSAHDRNTFRNVNVYYSSAREETVHEVKLNLENVRDGYDLSRKDRGTIIDFLMELLGDNLVNSFQLIGVEDAFNDRKCDIISPSTQQMGRLNTVVLPLRVAVDGPANDSDMAFSHVITALEDTKQDLEGKLKTYDRNTFRNANAYYGNAIKETTHEVQLNLENVPSGYSLLRRDITSIVDFVKDLLDDNLIDSFQLIEIDDVVNDRNQYLLSSSMQETNRLNTVSLPLRIAMNGPAEDSDSALCHLMMALEDTKQELEEKLKGYDRYTFRNAIVYYGDAMEERVYQLKLNLGNVPTGYRFTQEDRAEFIDYVKGVLDEHLDDALTLIGVAHEDNLSARNLQSPRSLGTASLPLAMTVRGPADVSDFALSYMMEILDEYKQDLARKLKTLDSFAFSDVIVAVDTYDFNSADKPMERTVHPVLLRIENAPDGYRLDAADRANIIGFLKDVLEEDIDDSLQLIKVADALDMRRRSLLSSLLRNGRRLDTVALPLLVTVDGPTGQSPLAPAYIIQLFRENVRDIELYLKSIYGTLFENVRVYVETYDIDDIPEQINSISVMDEEGGSTPWWVWILVVMTLLIFICCCSMCAVGYSRYRNKKYKEETLKETEGEMTEDTLNDVPERDPALVLYQPTDNKVVLRKMNDNHVVLQKPKEDRVVIQKPKEDRVVLQKPKEDRVAVKKKAVFPYSQNKASNSSTELSNDSSERDMMIRVPSGGNSDIALRSAVTFGLDPPSEHNLKLIAHEAPLALPPPEKKSFKPLCLARRSSPAEQSRITSSVMPEHPDDNSNVFQVLRELEYQPHSVCEPSIGHQVEKQSNVTQPISVRSDMSADVEPMVLALEDDPKNRTSFTKEDPSGIFSLDEHQSYHTMIQSHAGPNSRGMLEWGEDKSASYATSHPYIQSFATHTIRSASSSVKGGLKKKKRKGRNSRKSSPTALLDEHHSYTTQSHTGNTPSYATLSPKEPGERHGGVGNALSYAAQSLDPFSESQSLASQLHKSNGSSVIPRGPKRKKSGGRRKSKGSRTSEPVPGTQAQADPEDYYHRHSSSYYA